MGKSSAAAPAPDPRIGEAAMAQAQTGQEWLDFSREAFAISTERQKELDAITKQVSDQQLSIGQMAADEAVADKKRYDEVFKPVEDQFVEEATKYGSAENQAAAAATAKADIAKASADQKMVARRQAAGIGIDPTSGRYAGIEREGDTNTALATAGSMNAARQGVRDKGLALKADVVNIGRGVPAMAAASTATALGAGASAVGLNQSTNAQSLAASGVMDRGFSGQMQGYAGQAGTLQNLHNSQLSAWQTQTQANSQSAAGIGSALGGIAGLFLSDEKAKTKKKKIKDGKALDAVNDMRVEEWEYKEGRGDGGGEKHVGTYSKDFSKAMGKSDSKSIMAQDAIGITMKAVQDLDKKITRIAGAIGLTPQPQARAAA